MSDNVKLFTTAYSLISVVNLKSQLGTTMFKENRNICHLKDSFIVIVQPVTISLKSHTKAKLDESAQRPSLIACMRECVCVMQAPTAVSEQGQGSGSPRGRHLTFPAFKEGLNLSLQLLQTRLRQPQQCLRVI